MSTLAMPLLAPDAVFERRDELLDNDGLRARLSTLLGEDVDGCERVRATYHPGRSLGVLLHVGTADAELFVAARMFASGTSGSRFERARSGDRGAVLHDRELATVFSIFPFDRKLPALPELVNGFWPPIPGAPSSLRRLVAYAPERAATAAAADAEGRTVAFVKLHADLTGARTIGVHRALRARGIRVPAALASWPELNALAVEPLHGTRLAARDDVQGWRAFGRSLALLHRLEPMDTRRLTRLEPDALGAAATTIAALRPDVGELVFALEDVLRRTARARHGPIVCLHGDAHPKNVLIDAGEAGLVDLDDVAGGHAAADLGSALAGLRYDTLLGRRDRTYAEALLDGYQSVAPLPHGRTLSWYTGAALLGERALRSITRLRSEGLEQLDALVAAGLEEVG
jgi:aminoglycoside phosphotransferase (APT) family kinase protein